MSRHIDTHPDANPHFVRPFQPQHQDQLPHAPPRGPFAHPDTNPNFVRPFQPQNQDQLPHATPRGPFAHPDTNPHFVRPFRPQNEDQLPHTPPLGPFGVPPPQYLDQHPEHRDSHGLPEQVRPEPRQDYKPAQRSHKKQPGRKSRPVGQLPSFHAQLEEQKHPQAKHQEIQDKQTQPLFPTGQTPPHDHEQIQQRPWPHGTSPGQPSSQSQRPRPHGLLKPHPQETSFFAWSAAICCAIFWVVVIITGLVVLIIYLVFRPKTPKFDVSSATLNAAYLDMGYLLNADFTILANFTNPNKKVSVDFSYLIIDLYYGTTHIATEYIEPFSAHKRESMFANVHMVVSQVQLGALESQRLKRQMEINRAAFEVKGYFRARANFGKILRYSYWLHGDCKVVFTGPPQGVLVGRKCKTKR